MPALKAFRAAGKQRRLLGRHASGVKVHAVLTTSNAKAASHQRMRGPASFLINRLHSIRKDASKVWHSFTRNWNRTRLTSFLEETKSRIVPRPALQKFIKEADHVESSYASILSDLCNLVYDPEKVTDELLQQKHKLSLVAHSKSTAYGPRTLKQHAANAETERLKLESGEGSEATTSAPHQVPHVKVVLTPENAYSSFSMVPADPSIQHPHTLLSIAVSAGGSTRTLVVSSIDEDHAVPVLMPSQHELANTVGHNMSSTSHPLRTPSAMSLMSPRQPSAAGPSISGASSASAAAAKAAAAEAAGNAAVAAQTGPVGEAKADAEGPYKPPSDWLVVDDPLTKVRTFAIQGSSNIDHWQINFTFEPVPFEDPELGIMVHKGVYEAACKMYDDLLPLVRQHLATSPMANVCFTGHSLGGSLACVLMTLFVKRGVVPASALAPCYTFGAPAVFCGTSAPAPDGGSKDEAADDVPCDECVLECEMQHKVAHGSSVGEQHHGLLHSLGLSDEHMVNVMLHRDIVPRLFMCDYTHIAGLMKTMAPGLKSRQDHKGLYNFLGQVAVIRPDDNLAFVKNDGHHPMLPNKPGLYKLSEDHVNSMFDQLEQEEGEEEAAAQRSKSIKDLRGTMLDFMNYPHPLQTLTSVESYGANGTISRYHNPNNYTQALQVLNPAPAKQPAPPAPAEVPSVAPAVPVPAPTPVPVYAAAAPPAWQPSLMPAIEESAVAEEVLASLEQPAGVLVGANGLAVRVVGGPAMEGEDSLKRATSVNVAAVHHGLSQAAVGAHAPGTGPAIRRATSTDAHFARRSAPPAPLPSQEHSMNAKRSVAAGAGPTLTADDDDATASVKAVRKLSGTPVSSKAKSAAQRGKAAVTAAVKRCFKTSVPAAAGWAVTNCYREHSEAKMEAPGPVFSSQSSRVLSRMPSRFLLSDFQFAMSKRYLDEEEAEALSNMAKHGGEDEGLDRRAALLSPCVLAADFNKRAVVGT